MKKKGWLLVLLILIVICQFTVLFSFFHSFQANSYTVKNSIVEITKMNYVSGWASIDITGSTQTYPATLQFPNGTQIKLTSDYSFVMRFPRTGDCYCSASGALPGTNIYIDQNHPILAAIISNASSLDTGFLPESGTPYNNNIFVTYWFTIQGFATVSINGYGVSY